MPVNTSEIANLLRPGLAAITGDYPSYPSQWSEIFETYESDKAFEQEVEMRFLGLAAFRAEGAPTQTDIMGQRSVTTYLHRYVALEFVITRQAMLDNLYKTKFPMMAKSLKRSFQQTKELSGASILNNGFNTSFPIGDGQPLFSVNHPIDAGVVPNTPAVPADLNEASLEAGINAVQQFRDVASLICMNKPTKLIVPTQGQWTAERLLGSSFRTNTANNDISAVYNTSAVPQGYRCNQFLTQNNSWFLLTDAPDSFKHYIREPFETDTYVDFSTDNIMCKGVERYSFGVTNWRGAYGSNGP